MLLHEANEVFHLRLTSASVHLFRANLYSRAVKHSSYASDQHMELELGSRAFEVDGVDRESLENVQQGSLAPDARQEMGRPACSSIDHLLPLS